MSRPFSLSLILAAQLVFAVFANAAFGIQEARVPESAERGVDLSADEVNQGWIALFDGQSLFGWNKESDANWRVEDGCIVVDRGSAPGLLRTFAQFDQYALRLQFRSSDQTNSGVFVRTSPRPQDPAVDCIEVNIAPADNPFPTGSIVAHAKANHAIAADDAWHDLEIEVNEQTVRVSIDGRESSQANITAPLGRGYIGLQFNAGPAEFRRIHLKPLSLSPIFNERDLAGWKVGDASAAQFTVAAGRIDVSGGPGQLESEAQFGDFICQLKCNSGPRVNSGLFFRSIPGESMNGYEVQIDNAFDEGDRSKPTNGGTGCVFRRNVARRIVGNDEEWMAITLVAVGPRFAVWVNGYQVTDFKDEREPHENPRKGLRLDAGTLILQAHDEATRISFAELFCAELCPRQRGADSK